MILADVMAELGDALEAIAGLRTFRYAPDNLPVPAAIVAYPDRVEYDGTYRRGMDRISIPVVVVVSAVSDRASAVKLAAYMDGSGTQSVKAAIDGWPYTSCDVVTVRSAETEVFTIADVEYVAATFEVEVVGPGT